MMKKLIYSWGADEAPLRSIAVRSLSGNVMEELDKTIHEPSRLVSSALSGQIYEVFSSIHHSPIWKCPIAIDVEVDLKETEITAIRIYR